MPPELLPKANGSQQVSLTVDETFLGPPAGSLLFAVAAALGRVNSVYRMLGWGLMPVGALAGGFVAHAAGLRAPYIVAGLLCGPSLLAAVPLLVASCQTASPG